MNRDEWSRAHEVFQAVVDLDDHSRQDTLDRLGHEAPGVAATVRALLDGHSMQTGPFDRLEQVLTGGLEALPFDDDAAAIARDSGTRWLRLEELGRGGMGVVHLAEDRSLGRRVAIKTLAADVATSPRARRRLLQEARTVASLDHPNIVPIHEVGVDDHDALFLVFGYTPGETLKARLEREERLPLDETLAVAAGVARALAAAHERGIVHRDVKPSNVLVGDDGTVRLTDFGIARRPGVSGPASAFGTPAYMAPEAREGSPPDPRTDVWATGVVLHEMLMGHRPEVDAAGRAGAVELPPLDDARRPAVAAVLARMLAPDPADRFDDGAEMLEALEEIRVGTAGGFVSGAPPRPSRLRRGAWVAGGLTVVAAGLWWGFREAPPLPPAEPGSRGHVLWVDDDPSLSAAEERVLTRAGYRVTRVLSTSEALSAYDADEHRVVISDLGRSESGAYRERAGLELVRGLRSRDPGVRVVVFTSDRGRTVIDTSPEAGWVFGTTTTSAGLYELVERAVAGGGP